MQAVLRRSRTSRDTSSSLISAIEGIIGIHGPSGGTRVGEDGLAASDPDVWWKGQRCRPVQSALRSFRSCGASPRFSSTARPTSDLFNESPSVSSAKSPRTIDLDAPPVSLEYHGATRVVSMAPPDAGVFKKLLLFMGGYYSKQSAYMRAAKELNACVKEQATDPTVNRALDIPLDSFQHRHAMLCLHVWMVLKRLRLEGKPGKKISQVMYDEFQDDVEHMVRQAGVQVRLGKHLSELEKQFYGSCTAYDRAMGSEPPETLADALWRNVYQGEEARKGASERLARYVRRGVACLAKTPSAVVLEGRISFQ